MLAAIVDLVPLVEFSAILKTRWTYGNNIKLPPRFFGLS